MFIRPPYSPDLDPIEQVFARLKNWLRKTEKRTGAILWDAIGDALALFSPQECSNYFVNSGLLLTYSEYALVLPVFEISCGGKLLN